MLVHLIGCQRSLRLSSVFFHSFYFILLFRSYFYQLEVIFQLTDSFFRFKYLLLIPSRVFLISVIVLFVSVCLFFNSSRTLLILNVYKSSLSTLFKFAYLFFISFLSSQHISFVFIALFPTWRFVLLLFSSLCFI